MRGKEGVTLIEVMIVVVIVGMLAAIAIPAYTDYVTRSRRSEAFAALETVRAAQEMFRAEHGFYSDAIGTLPGCGSGMADYYTINVARTDNTHYTATAAATVGGKQEHDRYSQFRIDQDGIHWYYDKKDSSWHNETEPFPYDKKWEDLR